jgi:capsid protein
MARRSLNPLSWFGRPSQDPRLVELRRRNAFLKAYNQRVRAKYDAATTNPETERYWSQADFRSPRSANDKAIRDRLRSRSRYECQESNSFARGMLLTKQNDVIGIGPMLQVTTSDQGLNRAIEEQWFQWAKDVLLPRKLRTIHGAKICDGEGFAQRTFNDRSRNDVKLDLLCTEADLWTDPMWTADDSNVVDGIAYDTQGNPVSYKRLRFHPGDDNWFANDDVDTVPEEDVIHWFRADRPDQRRGIPEFTPALPLFAELRRYRLATISAAEIAADFSAVMYSDAPAFGESPDELDEAFLQVDLERRAMITLPAGWKMQQLKPEQPITGFGDFSEHILMEIGRVSQMPLNLVAGSSREYNFASGRLDYLLYWSHCDVERYDFACCVMEKIFGWWLDEALLLPGYLPRRGDVATIPHEWIWPPRRPIDEVKAAQADQIRWQMGHLTDEAWAKREQVDLNRHYEELQRMLEARRSMMAPVPDGSMQQLELEEQADGEQSQTLPETA